MHELARSIIIHADIDTTSLYLLVSHPYTYEYGLTDPAQLTSVESPSTEPAASTHSHGRSPRQPVRRPTSEGTQPVCSGVACCMQPALEIITCGAPSGLFSMKRLWKPRLLDSDA